MNGVVDTIVILSPCVISLTYKTFSDLQVVTVACFCWGAAQESLFVFLSKLQFPLHLIW